MNGASIYVSALRAVVVHLAHRVVKRELLRAVGLRQTTYQCRRIVLIDLA